MKYLKFYPEKCVGCRVCEEVCAELYFKVKEAEKSSIRISEKDGKFETTVCNQCGKCIDLCPTDAISVNSAGVVMINKKECVGCLMCVAECPCGAMFYHHAEPVPFKCSACSICVGKCPAEALEIVKEK